MLTFKNAQDDETLRKVAVWRMEGHTEDAIAARLGCARRTVVRQLALIRTTGARPVIETVWHTPPPGGHVPHGADPPARKLQ